jgi:hypothetical protein
MPAVTVDLFSASTVPLEMMFNSTALSLGTGFIWHQNGMFYLITNWHNVSGKDPNSGRALSRTGGIPNKLKIYLNKKGALGHKFPETFELYDHLRQPNWFVHPSLGNQVDVVALPLSPSEEPDWYAINQLGWFDLSVSIGQDVYILGYPFGIGPNGYPIWKRSSIASEPEVFTSSQRYILVDTASRPGMSGSPVIRRSWGTHMTADGGLVTNTGSATKLIGVYSGRLHTTDPLDAQLGLVWPIFFIDEIIASGTRDAA